MTEAEKHDLIAAWIALHQAEPGQRDENDSNSWAFAKLFTLEMRDPEQCWDVILGILNTTSNENAIGALAAGPVESLLARHGEKIIERVESYAANDPKFRHMLSGVWRNAMSDDIWNRVSAIQNRDSQ